MKRLTTLALLSAMVVGSAGASEIPEASAPASPIEGVAQEAAAEAVATPATTAVKAPNFRRGDKFKLTDDYDEEGEDKPLHGYRARQDRTFHWGFKGGVNITTYDSDADDAQAHMGQWGMILRWVFGKSREWCFQTEVFYARMGVRSLEKAIKWFPTHDAYVTGEDLLNQKFRLRLLTDNVQEAFVFKWYTPIKIAGTRGLNIQAGPLLSERFDYTISTSSPEAYLQDPALGGDGKIWYDEHGVIHRIDSTLRKFARGQNKFTVHGVVGIGYDNPTGIGVDFRLQMGITPVWKRSGPQDRNYNPNSHDRVWSVCFSYLF